MKYLIVRSRALVAVVRSGRNPFTGRPEKPELWKTEGRGLWVTCGNLIFAALKSNQI